MENTYFFTGFPGFIATSLIKQIIHNGYSFKHMYLLVLPGQLEKAQTEINKISFEENVSTDLFIIITGDITKPQLGIEQQINEQIRKEITHVFHLAAIYDLAVPEKIAMDVNVNGTKNVNDWILALPALQRFVYFSTSYVAGKREGHILESELEMEQSFKNHYERTKYDAEVLVKEIMNAVPTTIIRPGIVVGHSTSGETIKFDGPYFILNFLDKLRFFPIIPYLGAGKAEGNFVPVDYIFNATIYLSHVDAGIGKTYQLTDPRPYTMKEVYRLLMKEYLGREPRGTIPLFLAKSLLSLAVCRRWLRVEKEALDYFTCMAHYDCSQAQKDLQGSGISCPDFTEVIPAMVHFYKRHKNDSDKHLKIK
ncbi:SDR family oxidoreductase [Bacillus sp. FJAT-49736]|nr:SDR family oxidoreductase [Bacillus sp. FJAT-49736]MBS4173029.1 SDR family oxidoreductase [Bacillus sp. FJAT-49736]